MYARLAMTVPFRPTRLTAIRRSRPISAERVSRYDEHMTMTTIAGSVLHAIGRTPLVRLRRVVPAGAADVLVKLEFYNPTGSYKDRMALAMIEGAEARGALGPGTRVVEFTGGSTGSTRSAAPSAPAGCCAASRRRSEKAAVARASSRWGRRARPR